MRRETHWLVHSQNVEGPVVPRERSRVACGGGESAPQSESLKLVVAWYCYYCKICLKKNVFEKRKKVLHNLARPKL